MHTARIALVTLLSISLSMAATEIFERDLVISDLDTCIELIHDIHPNMYHALDDSTFIHFIDSIKTELPQTLTHTQTMQVFAKVLAQLQDGHTGISYENYLQGGRIFLYNLPPYRFRVMGEDIFILHNFSRKYHLPPGSRLLFINGKTPRQSISEMSTLLSYETPEYRDALIGLPIVWGLWSDFGSIELEALAPDGEIINVKTSRSLYANLAFAWYATAGFGRNSYRFTWLPGNIGYITLREFDGSKSFRRFLKKTFKKLHKRASQNLIIDLRQSNGGDSRAAEEIMQYISPVAFFAFDSSLLKISDQLLSQYDLDTTKYIPGTLYEQAQKPIELRENPYRFSGQVFILTSAYCFSTALDFPAMVRQFDAGLLVGSTPGGQLKSYGSPASVTLPGTGIVLNVSRKRFVNVGGSEDNKRLVPDIEVTNMIEDDISGHDRVLEAALQHGKSF